MTKKPEHRHLKRRLDAWIADFQAWKKAGRPARPRLTAAQTNWRIAILRYVRWLLDH